MRFVVLLRAANVGGHNVFQPKAFAAALPFEVTNIGAAGTFVVADAPDEASVRRTIEDAAPFDVAMAVLPGADVAALVDAQPFGAPPREGAKAEVTVLLEPVPTTEGLPTAWPDQARPEVLLHASEGPFVLTWRVPGGRLSPYKLVGDALGVPATTRTWGTFERIRKALG